MSSETEQGPLVGRRIVVTRPRAQAADFVDRLTAAGADVVACASIEIVPPQSWDPLDDAIRRIEEFDWVVFTSVNGVDVFFQRLSDLGRDAGVLQRVRLAAIGSKTSTALERQGLNVEVVPGEFRAERVAEVMREKGIANARILLPRAAAAREILPVMLREAGALVEEVASYDTVLPEKDAGEVRRLLREGQIDLVTFTSSSTVSNFVALLGDDAVPLLRRSRIGCIGPITAETARAVGLDVDVEPPEYTIAAFARAIVEYFSGAAQRSDP